STHSSTSTRIRCRSKSPAPGQHRLIAMTAMPIPRFLQLLCRDERSHVHVDGAIVDLKDDAGVQDGYPFTDLLLRHLMQDQLVLEYLADIHRGFVLIAVLRTPTHLRRWWKTKDTQV